MISSKVICCAVIIALLIVDAGAQNLSCTSNLFQPLCPGIVVSCTCNVTGITSTTRWLFTTLNQCPSSSNVISLTQAAPCSPPSTCGPYLSVASSNATGLSCPTSTLSIMANPSLNGLVVECRDLSSGLPGTLVGTMSISIIAPPSTPTIMVPSSYSDPLMVNWTSVSTATSYNISINGSTPITLPANANTYSFTGLTNNTTYTISVVAINCAGTSSASVTWPPPPTTPPPTTPSSSMTSSPMTSSSSSSSTTSATTQPQSPSPDSRGAIVGGVVGGVGGAILLAVVVVIVVVVVCKKKGNGGAKSKEDRVELQKSGGTAERSIPSHDVGAMYQDPNDIKRAEGPAGDMYAVADKPKPKGGAPADAGGALYQDPKDIEHTRGPAGEVYAVADKKPKEVPHQPAPTGDMYAVADTKKPSKRKHTQPEEEEEGGGYAGVSL